MDIWVYAIINLYTLEVPLSVLSLFDCRLRAVFFMQKISGIVGPANIIHCMAFCSVRFEIVCFLAVCYNFDNTHKGAIREVSNNIEVFQKEDPSLESYWRSIILFGSNTATYKFALAESLLDLVPTGKSVITLDELAVPYAKHLCEHIKTAPKQINRGNSSFLQSCADYNNGKITRDQLIDATVRQGFNYVLDAFHNVNNDKLPVRFYQKESKRITLTDDLYQLKELPFSTDFTTETESRWKLVETAWQLGISQNLLNVQYDNQNQLLFVDESVRRKSVTSVRGALNGYQKGKCFYCYDDITVSDGSDNTCDVDHFFPHTLQKYMPDVNLDGVWNLVLTCKECNRGAGGKFARVPDTKYLKRLNKRNEYLISSHHPLRQTIIRQTGDTPEKRARFLKEVDKRAINNLIFRWEVPQKGEATF
jgi:5-methylcytosine-specific restriction endonuclease McrA